MRYKPIPSTLIENVLPVIIGYRKMTDCNDWTIPCKYCKQPTSYVDAICDECFDKGGGTVLAAEIANCPKRVKKETDEDDERTT